MELANHGEGLLQFRYRHGGQNIPLRSCARRAALGGCLAMAGEGVFPPLLAVSALLAASPARAGEGVFSIAWPPVAALPVNGVNRNGRLRARHPRPQDRRTPPAGRC